MARCSAASPTHASHIHARQLMKIFLLYAVTLAERRRLAMAPCTGRAESCAVRMAVDAARLSRRARVRRIWRRVRRGRNCLVVGRRSGSADPMGSCRRRGDACRHEHHRIPAAAVTAGLASLARPAEVNARQARRRIDSCRRLKRCQPDQPAASRPRKSSLPTSTPL
jgi:hypothetical protein